MNNRNNDAHAREDRTHMRVRVIDKEAIEAESNTRRVDMIDLITAMRLLWTDATEKLRRGAIDRVHEVEKIPA